MRTSFSFCHTPLAREIAPLEVCRSLVAERQDAGHDRRGRGGDAGENRAADQQKSNDAERRRPDPHRDRHGRERARRKNRDLADHAGQDRGRDRAREHDDLRVLVEAARKRQPEHAPDLVRQEADQDQQHIGRQTTERAHRSASRRRWAAKATPPPMSPVHIRSSSTPRHANSGASTRPSTSATRSAVTLALRTAEIRNDIGDRNNRAATSRLGSAWASWKPTIEASTAPAMRAVPRPLAKGMRAARGSFGNSRSDSIHMLMAVKWAGTMRSRARVAGVFNNGISATTMGRSRMPLKPTASATSSGGAPAPSAEIRISWAGAAQISRLDSTIHSSGKPRSWASAPMLT